jgi:phosphate transport system protein
MTAGGVMERYYESQFRELRDLLLRMSYLAEENVSMALDGLFGRDTDLCRKVVESDREIDMFEVRIDQACIDLLLLRQPVAKDLRFVTMSMKINTNLERTGDQAVYIARVGCDLSDLPPIDDFFGLPSLGEIVKVAVSRAMESYIREDVVLAREVRVGDEEINRIHRETIQRLLQYMMENPAKVAQTVELIFLARSLERIADYAKNIADEVIYLVEAVDPRHKKNA